MSLKTMYPADNSLLVQMTQDVSATADEITVTDVTVFPKAPNFATIGTDNNAEVVVYKGIDTANNKLTGCLRGQSGTIARPWTSGAFVYHSWTAANANAMMENIKELNDKKVSMVNGKSPIPSNPDHNVEWAAESAQLPAGTIRPDPKYLGNAIVFGEGDDWNWDPANPDYDHPYGINPHGIWGAFARTGLEFTNNGGQIEKMNLDNYHTMRTYFRLKNPKPNVGDHVDAEGKTGYYAALNFDVGTCSANISAKLPDKMRRIATRAGTIWTAGRDSLPCNINGSTFYMYIDPDNGNDANTGESSYPKKTLLEAYKAACKNVGRGGRIGLAVKGGSTINLDTSVSFYGDGNTLYITNWDPTMKSGSVGNSDFGRVKYRFTSTASAGFYFYYHSMVQVAFADIEQVSIRDNPLLHVENGHLILANNVSIKGHSSANTTGVRIRCGTAEVRESSVQISNCRYAVLAYYCATIRVTSSGGTGNQYAHRAEHSTIFASGSNIGYTVAKDSTSSGGQIL